MLAVSMPGNYKGGCDNTGFHVDCMWLQTLLKSEKHMKKNNQNKRLKSSLLYSTVVVRQCVINFSNEGTQVICAPEARVTKGGHSQNTQKG